MVGADFALNCSATLALYFSSNCLKLEQIHWQYSCFALSYNHGFSCYSLSGVSGRNHSCKIDFSSLHFMMLPLNFAHYILVYYFK